MCHPEQSEGSPPTSHHKRDSSPPVANQNDKVTLSADLPSPAEAGYAKAGGRSVSGGKFLSSQLPSSSARRTAWLCGGLVFAVALLIQAVLITDYYRHSPFYSGLICDSKVYAKWAGDILSGDWLGHAVFHQAPLYPYLMALLWLIFGKHYLVIYLGQAFMTAFSCLLVFLISRHYFNNLTALAAGLLCAFYGTLNFYALKILPDTLSVFLHLWLAYLVLNAVSRRQWLIAGCVCGVLIIGRPHAVLFLPMVLVWIMTRDSNDEIDGSASAVASNAMADKGMPRPTFFFIFSRRMLKQFTFFLLPVIILVGMVTLRNFMLEPDLVLVSSNGGENFYMGNNPRADGIYCRMEGITPDIKYQKFDVKNAAEAKTGRKLTSAQVSRYWLAQGISFIRNNFSAYGRLELTKLKRAFSGTEYTNMYFLWFERTDFTRTLAVPAVHFYIVLPLAIIGLVLFIGQWRKYGLLYIMVLLPLLGMLIFYVDERYRLPMIPFLIILGTGGIYRLLEISAEKKDSWLANTAMIALILGAFFITVYMHRTEPERLAVEPQLYNNLAEIYYEKGEYQQALNAFYKSSRMAANNWEAEIGIAKVLFTLGKKDVAAGLYQQAFPNLDKELQATCLRDRDLDALRQYIQK
jgi:tetratricopeptide (TPR) repeat protein